MARNDDVRQIALALPEVSEVPHFETTSFRVRGKIFATLGDEPRATVKLDPDDQHNLVAGHPGAISPVDGYWGRNGWTLLDTSRMDPAFLAAVVRMAWIKVAPKKLVAQRL